jgi:hypothetical protein
MMAMGGRGASTELSLAEKDQRREEGEPGNEKP